jgi:hypothetical protein
LVLAFSGVATAGSNQSYKIALHLVPHEERACDANWPTITDCTEIVTTLAGCGDFDVFPVVFDLVEVQRIEYSLRWLAEWGDCVFTPCAGDIIMGDIISPGDGIAHEWTQCHQAEVVVTGYAWFDSPVSAGVIAPAPNPATGFLGATDCAGVQDLAIGRGASGVCGVPGEDACDCGCASEPSTWGGVKSMFR